MKRYGGLNETISALAWSPDGQYLAVGLQGRGGFRVLRADTGTVVATDPQYNDKLQDIDFSPQGRIVTVALDGMVRLYAADFRLIGRRVIPGGNKPISVRYSPDGELLAVGYIDAPVMSVVSGAICRCSISRSPPGLTDQVNFTTVVWSSDGNSCTPAATTGASGSIRCTAGPTKGRGQPATHPADAEPHHRDPADARRAYRVCRGRPGPRDPRRRTARSSPIAVPTS